MRIEFAKGIFTLDALKKAAYRLSDKLVIDFTETDNLYFCDLKTRDGIKEDIAVLGEAFKVETLDQDLREKLFKETEGVRNLVLAYTFSNTGL